VIDDHELLQVYKKKISSLEKKVSQLEALLVSKDEKLKE